MSDARLYEGREQSLVKHQILRRYLKRFAFIIGARWDSITYIDCFSGPWKSRSEQFADTSFSIAINELRQARNALTQRSGRTVRLRCFFLEHNKKAYTQLSQFAGELNDCEIETRNAKLEECVDEIVAFAKKQRSFPFVFVDPTGWTGFALDVIQPLLRLDPGEVLINFMTEHIRRFLDSPDERTQQSFERLFGSPDFKRRLQGLARQDREDAAVRQYMNCVRLAGGFSHASCAVVLNPLTNRSHFHLIYLTRNAKGIEVFKDSEKRAMADMEAARAEAQQRKRQCGGQRELFVAQDMHDSTYFDGIRERYLLSTQKRAIDLLTSKRRVLFDDLWTLSLSEPLVWESDVKEWISEWRATRQLQIEGMKPRQRVPRRQEENYLIWQD